MAMQMQGKTRQKTQKGDQALYDAFIFDMDGVVTQTASTHEAAWKEMFDDFLKHYDKKENKPFQPFQHADYLTYLDGRDRNAGVQSFLQSRGIKLPWGNQDDPPEHQTICGLGNRKNQLFLKRLHESGAQAYSSTVAFIQFLRSKKIKTAVISASKNCMDVLQSAHALDLFDQKVDGLDAETLHLRSKPNPDIFLEAAKKLEVPPNRAVVLEDAVAGVQAGKAGCFALVIGLDRAHHREQLEEGGADIVVDDLSALDPEKVLKGEVAYQGAPNGTQQHQTALPDQEEGIQEWTLVYDKYLPNKEGRRETLCTLGNGYFATRGAWTDATDDGVHYPGTYLAGGYNRLVSEVQGEFLENEDLVNFPNWLALTFKIEDGPWFKLDEVNLLAFRQELDLQHGVLKREIRFQDNESREILMTEHRLVHMEDFHKAALEMTLTAVNWSGNLTVRSALDGRIVNNNVKNFRFLNKQHLEALDASLLDHECLYLKVRANQSQIAMAQAARTRFFKNDKTLLDPPRNPIINRDYVAQDCLISMEPGEKITIEKVLCLYSSRDNAISECGLEARRAIHLAEDFASLLQSHARTWEHLWRRFDIQMSTVEKGHQRRPTLILRLHVFHLLQTASLNSTDMDIGVPARGWHGEGYRGHIFWDDLFVFQFFNLRLPDLTSSLLKYRYRRLGMARDAASQVGYRGAMFPWQSGSDGKEETPAMYLNPLSHTAEHAWIIDNTHLQRHVNSAIVYNIWQYYQVTGDIDFIFTYGAEIVLEIARFWSSIAQYNPASQRYEIHGVLGPDEFHDKFPPDDPNPGLSNNTYTNVTAVWVLSRAQDILQLLPEDYRKGLCDKISLQQDEIDRWREITHKMKIDFIEEGILNQFEGYETLPDLDLEKFKEEYGNIYRMDEILKSKGDSPNRYKVTKQPDVLMLFYLFSEEELKEIFEGLGYPFPSDLIAQNIAYYKERTSHGSTLSRVVYSWIMARMDRAGSFQYFTEALESDLNDIQGGTTPEGIHVGAMSGTVDMIQRCYTGLVLREGHLCFDPMLPDHLERIQFIMHYRFHALRVELTQKTLTVSAMHSAANEINIRFRDRHVTLEAGQSQVFHL